MSSSGHPRALLVAATLFAAALTARAQQCVPCDITPVAVVDSAKATLTYGRVARYLCTFNKVCRNSVEYSEYSNTVLFELLEKDPELVLRAIAHAPDLDTAAIFSEMGSPLSDPDVSRPIAKLKSGTTDPAVRQKMIAILEDVKRYIDSDKEEDKK